MLKIFLRGRNGTRVLNLSLNSKIVNSKRSQVGITITWFVAFLVIFFGLLIFIGIVATIAGEKGVGKNEIQTVEAGFNKVEQERNLAIFLDSFVVVNGKEESIKYLILNKKSDELEVELKKFIDGIEPKPACYFLRNEGNFEINELSGLGGRSNSRTIVDSFLKDKGSEVYLFDNGKKIKLEFYIGEC